MIDKNAVRKMIRRSLLPTDRADYSKRYWPKWLEDRLTTLAIYSYTDKNECPPHYIKALRFYSRGIHYSAIAHNMGLKRETVQKYIERALNWIIENTPDNLLENIPLIHTQWRLKGCLACHGDLMWDDADGAYECILCDRQFNDQNEHITKIGLYPIEEIQP